MGHFQAILRLIREPLLKYGLSYFVVVVLGPQTLKLEDYSTDSFVLAFIRFSCKVGYPKKVFPDAGGQLVKGCENMTIPFVDVQNRLFKFGVDFEICLVGSHYMHGKVERKIQHVKK